MLSANASPRICIVGAGAIGTTLAARLSLAGHTVSVLARGATLAAIRHNGVCLIDQQGQHIANVSVSDRCSDLGEQDIVFLCTKSQSVPELLPRIHSLFGRNTLLVPMVNGTPWWLFMAISTEHQVDDGHYIEAVDPGGKLVPCIPASAIIGCVVYISAQLKAPGVACSYTSPRLVIGGIDATTAHATDNRIVTLLETLETAGVATHHSRCIRDAVWTKIAANLTSNPLSVITDTTLEQLYGQPSLQKIVGQIFDETRLTANAYGSDLEMTLQELLDLGARMGAVKTSMLQDYQQDRALELTAIVEGVIELADRKDISVPTIKTILHLTQYFENAGPLHSHAHCGKEHS